MRGRRDRPREGQEFRRNHRILFVKCVAVKEEGKENRVFFFIQQMSTARLAGSGFSSPRTNVAQGTDLFTSRII